MTAFDKIEEDDTRAFMASVAFGEFTMTADVREGVAPVAAGWHGEEGWTADRGATVHIISFAEHTFDYVRGVWLSALVLLQMLQLAVMIAVAARTLQPSLINALL